MNSSNTKITEATLARFAREVAKYADGVIVGSAFIKIVQEHGSGRKGLKLVKQLAKSLSEGVRDAR